MSEFSPQSNFQAAYGEYPIVANRVFKCLECQQYVVFPSNLPEAAAMSCSIPAVDVPIPSFETIDQSGLSQQPFSYDFSSLQLSTSDHSSQMQSVISPSNLPDSVSFFPSDVSQIPFPQVIDIPMAGPYFDSYNLSSYTSRMETDPRRDETALLRMEIDQLKDIVKTLQERYTKFYSLIKYAG
jgi:hypothetical protein